MKEEENAKLNFKPIYKFALANGKNINIDTMKEGFETNIIKKKNHDIIRDILVVQPIGRIQIF